MSCREYLTSVSHLLIIFLVVGQMNFLAEKSSFKISDNPLIQCLDARSVNVKQFFDYLKTEEYRRYKLVYKDYTTAVHAVIIIISCTKAHE